MPETTNNSKIDINSSFPEDSSEETMIAIKNVGMTFNMSSEQLNNLKEYFLAIVKHNLFFEELRALDSINFEVKKGDVFGIVGTNGSGKSTLLKIVAGVLEPTDGSVEINGNIAPLIELGAGFDMELSARENIYLNGALLGHSKEFINEHFDEIVEFSEIEKFLDMPMKNYSSGMVARIAFAIATVIIPEILIVDEVLSVGDFMFQKKCEDKIMDLIKNHNTTVLIVSHSNDQIRRLCNKAIWIEKGHTRMLGRAETVCDVYGLVGGREGSLEAENTILDAHKKCEGQNSEVAKQVAHGGSFPEVCLSLDRLAGQQNVKTVCLANQTVHLSVACANALSGAKEAPIITFSDEKIDFHIIDWLESKKPEEIYIFDSLGSATGKEYSEHAFSWDPKIQLIESTSPNPFDITHQMYQQLSKEIAYCNVAVIVDFNDFQESSVLLAGLINLSVAPYFCMSLSESNAKIRLGQLKNEGFERFIVAGKNVKAEDVVHLKEAGYDIVDLSAENLLKSQAKIHNFLAQASIPADAKEAIVVSNTNAMHSLAASAGYYSTQKRAHTLIVDNTELDSIAYAVKFIQDNKIEKLTFLGGPGALSQSVFDLLSKVAASNQSK